MTDPVARTGVLYPAVAEVGRRAGATVIGLIDLGAEPGVNLQLDRVGIAYDNGQRLGDPSASVQVAVSLRGGRGVPDLPLPDVVSREAVDPRDLEALRAALERVPAGALPVVTTTWALPALARERRLRLLQLLDASATSRPVAWVSVEGVGVAPAIPTLGDRPASGHSIVGVTLLRQRTTHAEAVGRCWSRGRLLAWLAD